MSPGDDRSTASPQGAGLIRGLALDGSGGARHVSWAEVRRWSTDGGPLWIHLDRTQQHARRWLEEESGLDTVAVEALLSDSTRPRCVVEDEGLLLTLRGANLNPGAEPEDMVSVRIWVDRGRLITLRRERLVATEDVVGELERGKGPRASGELLARIVLRLVERIEPVVEEVEDVLDDLEDRIVDPSREGSRGDLIDARRQVIALHRFLSPQRLALASLAGTQHEVLSDDDRIALREVANRLTRCVEDLDAARERASLLQEEMATQLTERLESRIYVLSVIAAVVLPLTLLTGLLGMNVGGIPFTENRWGLAVVAAILAALGALLVVVLRWRRWL